MNDTEAPPPKTPQGRPEDGAGCDAAEDADERTERLVEHFHARLQRTINQIRAIAETAPAA
ncbi:hypothetical protein, partial [Nocardia cyriacigeorgica]|uniref:hypothetical protein n=1 Tax=Nocardia cyriacigeorgica TaxID=135487 RepID=UPI002453E791